MKNLLVAGAAVVALALLSSTAMANGFSLGPKAESTARIGNINPTTTSDAKARARASAGAAAVGINKNRNVAHGGDGGDGFGLGIAEGGNVRNSGNSENTNTARARGGDSDQAQGQQQGQIGIQDQNQHNLQGQVGIQGTRVDDGDITISSDDDTETNILTINPVALSNLPAAVCQGASSTGSANGGLLSGGFGVGFGKATVDVQCTIRENVKLVGQLAGDDPDMNRHILGAISQLEGFESLAAAMEESASVSGAPRQLASRTGPAWCATRDFSMGQGSKSDRRACGQE